MGTKASTGIPRRPRKSVEITQRKRLPESKRAETLSPSIVTGKYLWKSRATDWSMELMWAMEDTTTGSGDGERDGAEGEREEAEEEEEDEF